MPIADCRFSIDGGDETNRQSEIENPKSRNPPATAGWYSPHRPLVVLRETVKERILRSANFRDGTALLKERLILASKSPRRAQILDAVGWPFEQIAADIDESRIGSEDVQSYVKRLAQTKAETVAKTIPNGLVVGADTVVVIDGLILGQPRDDHGARRMLTLLSGKWHDVVTGVALLRTAGTSRTLVDHETTRVRFCEMRREEIDWYVSTGEPQDKAGAYAIQGKGALFVEEIQGDYFNVMGLPVRLVYDMSRKLK